MFESAFLKIKLCYRSSKYSVGRNAKVIAPANNIVIVKSCYSLLYSANAKESNSTSLYEHWLCTWTRNLINAMISLKEVYKTTKRSELDVYTELFKACKSTIRTRTELCVYLLPYIIYYILMQQDARCTQSIINEIKLVLGSNDSSLQINSNETANDSMMDAGLSPRVNARAVQLIFGLLDEFEKWYKLAISFKPTNESNLSNRSSVNPDKMDSVIVVLKHILRSIPYSQLGSAAVQMNTYVRALRYYEADQRQLHANKRILALNMDICEQTVIPDASMPGTFSAYCFPYNDCANGELPVLTDGIIDEFMNILTQLDFIETNASNSNISSNINEKLLSGPGSTADVLQGYMYMRHVLGYSITSHHKILEFKSKSDWMQCLVEYNLISMRNYRSNNATAIPAEFTRVCRDLVNSYDSNEDDGGGVDFSRSKNEIESDGWMIEMEVNRGRLECLLELEYLESVIDECRGISIRDAGSNSSCPLAMARHTSINYSNKHSNLHFNSIVQPPVAVESKEAITRKNLVQDTLYPLGIEASWKLQRWDDLEWFLQAPTESKRESNENSLSWSKFGLFTSMEDVSMSPWILENAIISKDEDDVEIPRASDHSFSVLLGHLLYNMYKGNADKFQFYVRQSKQVIMASVAAAAMESYTSAYSPLVDLHLLRDIEYGYSLLHSDSNVNAAVKLVGNSNSNHNLVNQSAQGWLNSKDRLMFQIPSYKHQSLLLAVHRCIFELLKIPKHVANSWYEISLSMLSTGCFDNARIALQKAIQFGYDSTAVLLQNAKLLKASDQVEQAILLLEPQEVDISALRSVMKQFQSKSDVSLLPMELRTAEARESYSNKCKLCMNLYCFISSLCCIDI